MSIENYMRAKADLDRASLELERTQKLLNQVSALLTEPVDFNFSVMTSSPAEMRRTFNAADFPHPEMMQAQIEHWRDRLKAAQEAWVEVEPGLRSSLNPPLGASYFDEFKNSRSLSAAGGSGPARAP